jgi:hypothetical protein
VELPALVGEHPREAFGDVCAAVVALWHGGGRDSDLSPATDRRRPQIYYSQTSTQIRQPSRRPSTTVERVGVPPWPFGLRSLAASPETAATASTAPLAAVDGPESFE